jgi:hypothetical protein
MTLHVNGCNVLPLLPVSFILWSSGSSTTAFSIQPCSPQVHGHQCLRPTTLGMRPSLQSRRYLYRRADNLSQHLGVSPLYIFAPPGSGYAQPEDYPKSELPDTYEPMMAFPGTMRPGKTPENMPFQDLPIGDDDPDPVPWPHFQQIEWHHRWSEPPHPHPGTMEDFIESLGRWATPEQEAALRAGVRRDVRQRQEQAEAEKRDTIITDDDDDDDEQENDDIRDEPLALGDGIFGKLGSDADRALTAAATVAPSSTAATDLGGPDVADDIFTDDLDDFLLDLGLDAELEDDGGDILPILEEDEDPPIEALQQAAVAASAFSVDDDIVSLGFDGDEDDDLEGDGVNTVPLEDFGDGDSLDVEDIFDEGGFDYDDGDYGGGDDAW